MPTESAPDTPLAPAATSARDRTARLLPAVAVLLLLLSLLPLATLIPGGFENATWRLQVEEWGAGLAIIVGLTVVIGIVRNRRGPAPARPIPDDGPDRWTRRAPALALAIGALSLGLSVLAARHIAGGQSMQIDEIAQTMQARTFASGHVTSPTPAPLEFFATQHMLYTDRGTFSQFPPGGPAAIALGVLLGAEWLVGPLFALAALLAWWAWLRATREPAGTALLAFALLALAPFALFMSGSRMNHVPAAAFVLGASVALAAVARSTTPRPVLALLVGLGYGLAANARPLDAAAFAVPGAVWLLALAARDRRRIVDLVASGIGVALPIAFLLWFNSRTTGHPLLFGYTLLWGEAHDLGFHPAPWGTPHTPARGLELVSLYLFQLQRNFLETPVPSLLAAIGALWLTRRTSAADRYLLAGSGLTLVAYWAYWHEGYFLGPRFLYPLLPALALWTARFPALLRERLRARGQLATAWPPVATAMALSLVIAVAYAIPMRWRQYHQTFGIFRWNAADAARAAGVRNALVLVRDGWESQLVVRQWSLGMSHPQSELFYRAIDACRLDLALARLEQDGADSAAVERHLTRLARDSGSVQAVRLASGANVRVQAGLRYPPACLRRVREVERGIVALAPILAQPADGNVYARDLHARDTLLLARYPGRPLWLLTASDTTVNAVPRFSPVNVDSMRLAWAEEISSQLGGR
jgi:hypothetical protein